MAAVCTAGCCVLLIVIFGDYVWVMYLAFLCSQRQHALALSLRTSNASYICFALLEQAQGKRNQWR